MRHQSDLQFRKSDYRDSRQFSYWLAIDDPSDGFGIQDVMTAWEYGPRDLIGQVYMVEKDGNPIGFVGLYNGSIKLRNGRRSVRASRRYLTPECRGKGYGDELMAFIKVLAAEEGLTEIYAVTHEDNLPAQKSLSKGCWSLTEKINFRMIYTLKLTDAAAS